MSPLNIYLKQFYIFFQEAAKFFISTENLEQEIEKALNMEVNYNFSIDLKGNRYIERPDYSTEKSPQEASDDSSPRLYSETGGDESQQEAEASWQHDNKVTEKWRYVKQPGIIYGKSEIFIIMWFNRLIAIQCKCCLTYIEHCNVCTF